MISASWQRLSELAQTAAEQRPAQQPWPPWLSVSPALCAAEIGKIINKEWGHGHENCENNNSCPLIYLIPDNDNEIHSVASVLVIAFPQTMVKCTNESRGCGGEQSLSLKTHRPKYKAFIPLQSSEGITRYCISSAAITSVVMDFSQWNEMWSLKYSTIFVCRKCDE